MASNAATAIQTRRDSKRSAEENPAYKVVSSELRFLQSSVERDDAKWSMLRKAAATSKGTKK